MSLETIAVGGFTTNAVGGFTTNAVGGVSTAYAQYLPMKKQTTVTEYDWQGRVTRCYTETEYHEVK